MQILDVASDTELLSLNHLLETAFLHSTVFLFIHLQIYYSPEVLVIPRKRWLRPNMTEKLLTGMLRINQPTNQPTYKYELAILLHSKSLKKFEYWSTNKNLTPKIDLDLAFCMCKGGNPKLKFRILANLVTFLKHLDFCEACLIVCFFF